MKKILCVVLVIILSIALISCGGGEKARLITGNSEGTYYAFGSVLAQHATNNSDAQITAIPGSGSRANIMALLSGDAELAFCQSDVMAYAYNGTNLFAEDGAIDCFKTVAALYNEQVQIVTCNPNIKTVADLKGKNVSVGESGSGTYFNALDILNAYGMTLDDITPTYQSFGDSADALKDMQIDAAFIVAGAPTTAVTDLSTSKDVYLIDIESEYLDKLVAQSPYYTKCVIEKDVYGLENDANTVAVGAIVLAKAELSEDIVYEFVKDIFETDETGKEAHGKYAELNLEFATSVTTVPYHSGAAKYFAEKGYTVYK